MRSAESLRPGMRLSLAMHLSWGPRKSRIFGESRGLGRPLIKWSGISHCDPSAECAAKLLLFFDMAMGWFGLRAVLVRILCICLLFSDKYSIFKKNKGEMNF